MYKLAIGIGFGLLLFCNEAMAACSVPNTLTNGTTADATAVMGNFNSLASCAAPLASPNLTGTVSIGTSGYISTIGRYSNSSNGQILWNNGTGPNLSLAETATGIYTFGAGVMGAPPSSSVLVLDTSSGNVGIGTNAPAYPLHVNGTAYATGAAGALSDIRHKMNISPLRAGALDEVMRLQPVTFYWREPKDQGMQGRQMGFIAQEVERIAPTVVLTQDNAEKTKGLKYNELIALLTKAMQEQQAQIQALKAEGALQVKALKAANDNQHYEIGLLRSQIVSLESKVRVQTAAR